MIFGAVGLVISGLMVRRYYTYWCRKQEDAKRRLELEHTRRERRRRVRDVNVTAETTMQKCVVCSSNPQEVGRYDAVCIPLIMINAADNTVALRTRLPVRGLR